jgi:hypothetical protein
MGAIGTDSRKVVSGDGGSITTTGMARTEGDRMEQHSAKT